MRPKPESTSLNRVLRTDEFVLASIPSPPVIVPGNATAQPREAFIVMAEKLLNKERIFQTCQPTEPR